jgi:hypothetical protein
LASNNVSSRATVGGAVVVCAVVVGAGAGAFDELLGVGFDGDLEQEQTVNAVKPVKSAILINERLYNFIEK